MMPYAGAHRSSPATLFDRNGPIRRALHGSQGLHRFRLHRFRKLSHATPNRNSGIPVSPACQHRWYTVNTRSSAPVKQYRYCATPTGLVVATYPHNLELLHPLGAHHHHSTASPDVHAQEIEPELDSKQDKGKSQGYESPTEPEPKSPLTRSSEKLPEAFQYWCRSNGFRLRRKFSLERLEEDGSARRSVLCCLTIRGIGIDGEIHTSGNGQNNVSAMQNASMSMIYEMEKQGMWNPRKEAVALNLLQERMWLRGARILIHEGIIESSLEVSRSSEGIYTALATFKVSASNRRKRTISRSAPTPREAKEKALSAIAEFLDLGDVPKKYHFSGLLEQAKDRHKMQKLLDSSEGGKHYAKWGLTDDDIQAFYNVWDREWLVTTFVQTEAVCQATAVLQPRKWSFATTDREMNPVVIEITRGNNLRKTWERAILGLIKTMKARRTTWSILRDLASGTKLSITDKMTEEISLARVNLHHAQEQFPKATPIPSVQKYFRFTAASSKYERNRSKLLKRAWDKHKPTTAKTLAKKLPVSQVRQKVLDLINNNTFSIFSSKTGSGKSTQVPQIILDDAISRGRGGECRVLCIQPRRLAAQLLAQRVAEERGETVGDTVGCYTRFDNRPPRSGGTITYCTTGIALNMFQTRIEMLESYSHIILDEAHVRDVNIDFLMILLKRHVARCKSSGMRVPHIVIMSATIELRTFTSYFGTEDAYGKISHAPSLLIPGSLHKVKHHYLDDLLDSLVSKHSDETSQTLLSLGRQGTSDYLSHHYRGFDAAPIVEEAEIDSADPWERDNMSSSPLTVKKGLEYDNFIPTGLIAATILHILSTTKFGAILAFLPGSLTIDQVQSYLQQGADKLGYDLSNENLFKVIKLHAEYPSDMARLKEPFPEGCRRILLSTDVAEASVTIPDVRYVIDSGRFHRPIFDASLGSREIVCSWIGQSNAVQRAGRAGRVGPGEYFFLGTKRRYDSLPISISPEFLRGDLRSMCLKAKYIAPHTQIDDLLAQNIDAPDANDVVQSIYSLKLLGALDKDTQLTPLGSLIAQLPGDPTFAKLILLGIIFRCLDPMIILGLYPAKSLFANLSARNRIDDVIGLNESRSDHITMIRTFGELRRITDKNGFDEALKFAVANELNFVAFRDGLTLGNQLIRQLVSMRLCGKADSTSNGPFGGVSLNTNSGNHELIKALLAYCLSPNFARPQPRSLSGYDTKTGASPNAPQRFLLPYKAFKRGEALAAPRKLVIFSGIFQAPSSRDGATGRKLLNEISLISPLTACLFGGSLERRGSEFAVDEWLNIPFLGRDMSVSTDEGANAIIQLHETLGQTISDALNALHPSQEFESPEDGRGFHRKRVQLFRDLEKAVLRVIDADDHPVDFFRRRDGLPAPKSTSILASPEDRPVDFFRREDELPAARTTSILASPEDRHVSHKRVRFSLDLEKSVLRVIGDDDHPVDSSRREDGPPAPKSTSISASPKYRHVSHVRRVRLLKGSKKISLRAIDADGHPVDFSQRRDELSASKTTSILAPTNGAAPSSEDSPSQEDAPSSEETPNPVTRSDESKEN